MSMTLKAARVNAGYTQIAAATAIGVSDAKLRDWERGVGLDNMTWGQRKKIEQLYNTPADCISWLENIGTT